MKAYLGLNDEQTTQIKTLLTNRIQNQEAKKAETQALNGQLTEAKKAELKAAMEAEKTAMNSQLQQILTPEQYTKWQSTGAGSTGKL